MAKIKSGSLKSTLNDFSNAVDEAIREAVGATYAQIDRGLDKAAKYAAQKLEEATPEDTGITRGKWKIDFKYKNVRYINNTRLNEKGVPVVNLLEFGSKGKPFVRKIVETEQNNVINIIKGELKNDNTK